MGILNVQMFESSVSLCCIPPARRNPSYLLLNTLVPTSEIGLHTCGIRSQLILIPGHFPSLCPIVKDESPIGSQIPASFTHAWCLFSYDKIKELNCPAVEEIWVLKDFSAGKEFRDYLLQARHYYRWPSWGSGRCAWQKCLRSGCPTAPGLCRLAAFPKQNAFTSRNRNTYYLGFTSVTSIIRPNKSMLWKTTWIREIERAKPKWAALCKFFSPKQKSSKKSGCQNR